MANFESFKNHIADIGFKSASFKNDKGETVDYTQTVVRVILDGDVEEIVISGETAPKPRLLRTILKGATKSQKQDTSAGNFLED